MPNCFARWLQTPQHLFCCAGGFHNDSWTLFIQFLTAWLIRRVPTATTNTVPWQLLLQLQPHDSAFPDCWSHSGTFAAGEGRLTVSPGPPADLPKQLSNLQFHPFGSLCYSSSWSLLVTWKLFCQCFRIVQISTIKSGRSKDGRHEISFCDL